MSESLRKGQREEENGEKLSGKEGFFREIENERV